jgi:hypothetical protein
MGRYYDDKISDAGLDPANAFFGPLMQAAERIDQAEEDWYERRRDMFKDLNGGNSVGGKGPVEIKYSQLRSGLSVYDFTKTFNDVNPTRRSGSGIRYVQVPDDGRDENILTFGSPLSNDAYVLEEDYGGDLNYLVADDVLEYTPRAGDTGIDTLYTNVRAFTSRSQASGYFEVDQDFNSDGYSSTIDVYVGFGEVPLAWNPKSGFSSQQLQVMRAAGSDYDSFVGPVINEYEDFLDKYADSGGGPLEDDFYEGTPDFPYDGFQGSDNSYNRPQNLQAELIKQARGFTS